MFKIFVLISILTGAFCASADALFPLASGRPQQDGNCWAYGASHMIEAKLQSRDGISAMGNIEKTYRYWLLHDRLLNSFHRKQIDEGDGSGEGINDIGAFAADLFEIYESHGFEMIRVQPASKTEDLAYPAGRRYTNAFQRHINADGFKKPEVILKAEQDLIHGNFSESEALALIDQALADAYDIQDPFLLETSWLENKVKVSDTFLKILGTDYTKPGAMVLLTSTLNESVPAGQWLHYDSGRFLAISYTDPKQILKVVRASLDRGWPTTFETIDHVMTAIGYKTLGDSYVYAISNSSTAYTGRDGISWVNESDALKYFTDATVHYDTVADLVPKPTLIEALLPSVKLPRKR